MPIEVCRIDDRLIHGQVVVGWGQPLQLAWIVLVDDEVATSEWEQELYRMGVPPEMEVFFETVGSAAKQYASYQSRGGAGLLLTGDIATMRQLCEQGAPIAKVNLGGVHHRAGRQARLRYVFLTPEEEADLRALAARGITVTAQDVPAAAPVSLDQVFAGHGE